MKQIYLIKLDRILKVQRCYLSPFSIKKKFNHSFVSDTYKKIRMNELPRGGQENLNFSDSY